MDAIIEILIWMLISVVIFYVCNVYGNIKTAASLVLSFLVASLLIYIVYKSIYGEIFMLFAIYTAVIYAVFRAVRDIRPVDTKQRSLLEEVIEHKT